MTKVGFLYPHMQDTFPNQAPIVSTKCKKCYRDVGKENGSSICFAEPVRIEGAYQDMVTGLIKFNIFCWKCDEAEYIEALARAKRELKEVEDTTSNIDPREPKSYNTF